MSAVEAARATSLTAIAAQAEVAVEGPEVAIVDFALDSRQVAGGWGFVALPGYSSHGLEYLGDALARGAAAVLYDAHDRNWSAALAQKCRQANAAAVAVADLARHVGALAAALYGRPDGQFQHVVAVTGTDGKTTVAHFVAAMLDDSEAPCGVMGTLGSGRMGATEADGLTTPDAPAFQRALAQLGAQGFRRLAVEASSHGLAQYRLDGTRIDAAVLTQIGRDHLDYHGSQAAYAAAKQRLFHWPDLGAAVLNVDDAYGERWAAALAPGVACLTYGRHAGALQLQQWQPDVDGIELTLTYDGASATVRLALLGAFNADNTVAAAGALLGLGYTLDAVAERLQRIAPVPGRMELFRVPGRPGVVVDYAHTPGALEAALSGLRDHTGGRVWCIFGAGGDRDRGKRPAMGAAAVRGADRVIVTDDNPRSEEPAAIVADILAGMPDGNGVQVEHDRRLALAAALHEATPSDLILLAGKGHEGTQIRGRECLDWSDRDAARQALQAGDSG